MNSLVELLELHGALFATLAAIASVLGVAFKIYMSAHRKHIEALEATIRDLEAKNKKLHEDMEKNEGPLHKLVAQLETQLKDALDSIIKLKASYAEEIDGWVSKVKAVEAERDHHIATCGALTAELEAAKEEIARRDKEEITRLNLLKKAMRLEGKVWERKVMQGAPRFRPLSERHAPIISVLNLKGGVGKTTVTSHLGAGLASKGYRVLLMDLDLQGSLSSLFMPETTLYQLSKEGKLLQHFLLKAAERRKANLLECCVPIFDGKSAVVPNADSMAYAELNLTMHWLLRMGKRDTRFLLRKALHQKRITQRYDVVLLDCPPLFNTACVNALAASDYIVIPVVPSKKAAERVPLLLERVQSLHQVINPQLQLMGVLLNRSHASSLTAWEQDLWGEMLERGQDRWRLPVHAFDTVIRQTPEVRDCETEFSAPSHGSELHSLFSRLVAEVEERLPGDCRRTSAAAV